jgi:hypothetical protein
MLKISKSKLRVSLSDALLSWWERATMDIEDPPFLGDNGMEILADSVINVLEGISDNNEYLKSQKLMKD